MGQKVHASSLRLYKTNRWSNSAWFSQLYYKSSFLKDWFLRKTTKKLFRESKYITPKIFTRFWNGSCDVFVFFLSKRKEYKKILFRFQSFLKTKIKEETGFGGGVPFVQSVKPGGPETQKNEYLRFVRKTFPSFQKTKEFQRYTNSKNKLQRVLWQKLEYERK